ncbi:hypothetical protein GW17_00033424 [Ensete ventricosum]|nr:hypothetical protein GW17_00033424 [Ensete ventricosum]
MCNHTQNYRIELKIAYRPGERFSVRDFHHAVNSISLDNFLPDVSKFMHTESSTEGNTYTFNFFVCLLWFLVEMPLTDLLNKNALYKWGSDDVPKKVIVICSSITTSTESLRRSLMDAAERCITVEFVVLEQAETNLCYDDALKLIQFSDGICDLENCVIRSYPLAFLIADTWILNCLVKKWFQELKDDTQEPLQAVFLFKNGIVGSVNQIHCNLFPSYTHITDGFSSCQVSELVKSITSLCAPANPELNLNDLQQQPLTQVSAGQMSPNQHKEKTSSCLTEEWERLLIVDELISCSSPSFPTPRNKTSNLRAQAKPLDEKTSRILERLEAPKQQISKAALSSIPTFNSSSNQPLKPNFQKLKRKQR